MNIPVRDVFAIGNLNGLRSEIARLGFDIPVDDDLSMLGTPLSLGSRELPNRLCAQPIEGCDAEPDGSPGPLTFRRYTRLARGGFGLIWVEATAVTAEARSSQVQLCLHAGNVDAFKSLVDAVRDAAAEQWDRNVVILLQLAHAGRYCKPKGAARPVIAQHNPLLDREQSLPEDYPLISDEDLERLSAAFAGASRLAAQAGFDGVDVKSCHRDLGAELLAAVTRPGRYGGSFENRARFLRDTVKAIRIEDSSLLVGVRLSIGDLLPYPYAFGVSPDDRNALDLDEPRRLATMLGPQDVSALNVVVGVSFDSRDVDPHPDPERTADYDAQRLRMLARSVAVTGAMQRAFGDGAVVCGEMSWLREFAPHVAAGVVRSGVAAIAGLGRAALAYPSAAGDALERGRLDPAKCCITCSACTQLFQNDMNTGCVIRDSEVYGAEYRHLHRFSLERLREEARRCRQCRAAPCSEACPTRVDVPGFIRAFAEDDIPTAYRILRNANVLPEMCSHLCPAWMQCEGHCIENALSGNPIPIRDIQFAVCAMAREQGLVAVPIEAPPSGKHIAVVGAGPAGLACAVTLLEKGHQVDLYDRERDLGGTPEVLIPEDRCPTALPEITEILEPASSMERLQIRTGEELGRTFDLADLRARCDAVAVAGGLWQERSLGEAEGVMDAVTFLRGVKRGEIASVPQRVAVLAGGDCAMDAAMVAQRLGANDVYVVYEGSRSDMHWHMEESWFSTHGAHCVTLARPLAYETDGGGKLCGLRICRTRLSDPDASGARHPVRVPGSESVLRVEMVIEAMGLEVARALGDALEGHSRTREGLIKPRTGEPFAVSAQGVFVTGAMINGGASVAQCVAEGMATAEAIDRAMRRGVSGS